MQLLLLRSKILGYVRLMKPRVMSLVIFTAFVGMFLAQEHFNFMEMIVPLFCISVASGASASLNMWYDADIDAIMQRTKNRPIPTGLIKKNEALIFGLILSAGSVFLMHFLVNNISAVLLLLCILYYIVIYTIWLKRLTVQNIVIGGAAGAIPPIIGCTSITGHISWESITIFAIVFFWTPPHFWALSLVINDDYKKAKIPMMSVIKGDYITKKNVFIYTIILAFCSIVPGLTNMFGPIYLISAILLNLYFLHIAKNLLLGKAMPIFVFKYSIIYLFLLLLSLILDKMINISILA